MSTWPIHCPADPVLPTLTLQKGGWHCYCMTGLCLRAYFCRLQRLLRTRLQEITSFLCIPAYPQLGRILTCAMLEPWMLHGSGCNRPPKAVQSQTCRHSCEHAPALRSPVAGLHVSSLTPLPCCAGPDTCALLCRSASFQKADVCTTGGLMGLCPGSMALWGILTTPTPPASPCRTGSSTWCASGPWGLGFGGWGMGLSFQCQGQSAMLLTC